MTEQELNIELSIFIDKEKKEIDSIEDEFNKENDEREMIEYYNYTSGSDISTYMQRQTGEIK